MLTQTQMDAVIARVSAGQGLIAALTAEHIDWRAATDWMREDAEAGGAWDRYTTAKTQAVASAKAASLEKIGVPING